MKALRIVGQTITHATSRWIDFNFYAYTACVLRVAFKEPRGNSPLAKRTDDPVDCMACLVKVARDPDPILVPWNGSNPHVG